MDSLQDRALEGEVISVEDQTFRQVLNPSATVVFPENASRGDIILTLSRDIPTNPDFGHLPLFYIRSDLLDLPRVQHQGYILQSEADCAGEALSYSEGFPTLPSGSPWWMQLPHEPYESHCLFKAWLDLGEIEGIRLLDSLAIQQQLQLPHVKALHGEYYWGPRARAYDLFIVAATQKRKEARRRRAEDEHFTTAGKILDLITMRFNNEPELIAKMEPTDLLSAMESMIKVQRLSLGLSSNANSGEQQTPGQSAEVILRSLTKNTGLTEQAQEGFGARISALMEDPTSAMQVQELIIRTTSAGNAFPNG